MVTLGIFLVGWFSVMALGMYLGNLYYFRHHRGYHRYDSYRDYGESCNVDHPAPPYDATTHAEE
jgi:hypothetical protein